DRQALDSATDILSLSLNLAGAAVGSATTKTILAAIAAGVTGSRAIIERDYYYEKTVPALVAQMNVSRKQALIPILQGIGQTIDQYSIANALDDLNTYYCAGTFTGAINAIQANAATTDASVSEQIADLTKIPQSVIDFKKKVLAWVNANRNEATKLNDVKAALAELGDTTSTATMDIGAATTELHRWILINVTTQDQLTKAQKALSDNHIEL